MPFLSEITLQKLETFFTNRRDDKAPFWLVWMKPNLLLEPMEEYSGRLLLRVGILSTIGLLLFVSITFCVGLAAGALSPPSFG